MKRIRKTLLCIFLSVLMLVSTNVTVFGADSEQRVYKISGYIMPEVSVSQSLMPAVYAGTMVEVEGTQLSAATDEKGYFQISDVPENVTGYKLTVSKPNYLKRNIDNVVVAGDVVLSTESAPITIWAGDISRDGIQDGSINISDIMSLVSAFNTSSNSPKFVKEYDLNMDDAINITDILIVAKNFNKSVLNYMKYYIPLPMVGSFENLKGMLNLQPNKGYYYPTDDMNMPVPGGVMPTPAPIATATPGGSGGSNDYSTVNNQVEGVDEADVVQTDGEYIYQVNRNRIIVAKAYPANEMSVVKVVQFADDNGFAPSQLLMGENKLIVIGSVSSYIKYTPLPSPSVMPVQTMDPKVSALPTPAMSATPAPYYYYYGYTKTITKAVIIDLKDKTEMKKIREIDVEGSYLSARKIGSYLYLVANKSISYYDDKDELDTLKPTYRDTNVGQEYSQLGFSEVHYFPEFVRPNYMTIAGLNVDDPDSKLFVSSYLGAGRNMYVSQNNIYIAETGYYSSPIIMPAVDLVGVAPIMPKAYNTNGTLIYKFSMEKGNVTFAGKGEAPGTILNQFSMDEYKDHFRIATTSVGENYRNINNLYIMDGELKVTGKIEGIAPGEKIYSTRFMGDRGYMVTFKNTDPLFVFDLKDPAKPEILGQLKIPGYSNYLHPYDENHIIGIGKDTVEAGYSESFAWYQGMKIALFDITDVNNPVEMFKEIIGDRGTTSELLTNHKALLFSKSKNLMAFPVTLMTIPESQKTSLSGETGSIYGTFEYQGAYVYNVDLEKGFQLKGRITHITPEEYQKYGNYYYSDSNNKVERIMYIDDTLYTLSKDKIKANNIDDLKELNTLSIPDVSTTPTPSAKPKV